MSYNLRLPSNRHLFSSSFSFALSFLDSQVQDVPFFYSYPVCRVLRRLNSLLLPSPTSPVLEHPSRTSTDVYPYSDIDHVPLTLPSVEYRRQRSHLILRFTDEEDSRLVVELVSPLTNPLTLSLVWVSCSHLIDSHNYWVYT